jgi:transcriptional regulator with XRE-family HTH domain
MTSTHRIGNNKITAAATETNVDQGLGVAEQRADAAKWPPNSIKFYRELAGLTQAELAQAAGTSHQQVYRLENRQRKLDPEWATRLARPLGCAPEDLAYSSAPNAYPWAIKAIPVVGQLTASMEITRFRPEAPVKHIGVLGAAEHTVAIEITAAAIPMMKGLYLTYLDSPGARLKMTPEIVERQNRGSLFVVQLKQEPTLWFRTIQFGTRRGRYHLNAVNQLPIADAEIAWVTQIGPIVGGRQLPEED